MPKRNENKTLRGEVDRLKAERDQFMEQAALRDNRDADMQEIMRINERLRAAIAWVLGEGPDEDGELFGDGKTTTDAGQFWWRTKLRALAFPWKG